MAHDCLLFTVEKWNRQTYYFARCEHHKIEKNLISEIPSNEDWEDSPELGLQLFIQNMEPTRIISLLQQFFFFLCEIYADQNITDSGQQKML